MFVAGLYTKYIERNLAYRDIDIIAFITSVINFYHVIIVEIHLIIVSYLKYLTLVNIIFKLLN